MSFLLLYVYIIAGSFLISLNLFFIPRSTNQYLKLFPPFLLLTLAAESTGQYLRYLGDNNVVLYNFFSTFEFAFYLWIISLVIQNPRVKKLTRIILLLYLFAAAINIFLIQGLRTFHSNSYCLGCLLVVALCVYYFLELFRLPKYDNLLGNPAFWICTGLLFFYSCSFPLFGLIHYWSKIPKVLIDNIQAITNILNIFLYTLFTIAFLCARSRKYTLLPS
ncbi:MAG: hypothetical protein H7Y01_06305 [Ferruginibacter sp.]|nr:hypothetical protein [Chitinophagaceae bacterium]